MPPYTLVSGSPNAGDALAQREEPREEPRLSPDGYAHAVSAFSKLPFGQNYKHLAEFLANKDPPSPAPIDSFLTLYRIGVESLEVPRGRPGAPYQPLPEDLQPSNVIHFQTEEEFAKFQPMSAKDPESQLLFLKGFASAGWLNEIGSKYQVDPEFFNRHLEFSSSDNGLNTFFSLPALPSPSWHLIQLPVMTLGVKSSIKSYAKQDHINGLRNEGAKALANLHSKIMRLVLNVNESMIRQFYNLDEMHFAVEQRISICMRERGNTFIAIIWLDCGRDFGRSTAGPWGGIKSSTKSQAAHFLPVIIYKPRIALKAHLFSSQSLKSTNVQLQGASMLHVNYGRSLKPSIMVCDAFYALKEVFSLVAASEMQFMNLLNAKLEKFTHPSIHREDSLLNLRYLSLITYRHIQQIEEILNSIENTNSPKWTKATSEELRRKARLSQESLLQDFKHLQRRANMLYDRCNFTIGGLMESISVEESRKAIVHAKQTIKIIMLAFIYISILFIIALPGINLRELNLPFLSR